ncbi:MAG: hypothetical protein KAJ32_07825 [Gammaproteobacteria bacterium]|nr:hypothetical protein [Gammaproteobacteria bacterium]
MNEIPVIQRVIAILWPSFITAGIATIIFTTAFDPEIIFVDYDISRLGVYTISFFLFWLLGAVTAISTCFFLKPCSVTNRSANNDKEKV